MARTFGEGMMAGPLLPIVRIGQWISRIVHRRADLLEVFSGCGTVGLAAIALINHSNGKSAPSMDLLSQSVSEPMTLCLVGALAALQPWALHLDDPRDHRHPFEQPKKWLRALTAGTMVIWYLTLAWAVGLSTGLSQVQAMYGMASGMNLYILAHVLTRRANACSSR
ncbi:hypothetical protein BKE38_05025 [Pseudoroseomonas deserti]|uniref:Uncharacterized protein n=1 Tax=Teichococcus deserti TaxID=1817963 RepID=A0A1V2H5U7_9PROT|nr:hypothetical protein [Pseudoroseomonas deserti]ONG56958.1 hypothetical protein BKE38_05025 [Pseudoroseomonas deserti]